MRFIESCYKNPVSTLIKRLQHFCQEITALLSTLLSRESAKHNKNEKQKHLTKHNKINFFLLCALVTLIFYLYIQVKKYFTLLKTAEGNVNFILNNDVPQSDTKRQKLIKCILTGNSKLCLGKVFTEEQINKLRNKPSGYIK